MLDAKLRLTQRGCHKSRSIQAATAARNEPGSELRAEPLRIAQKRSSHSSDKQHGTPISSTNCSPVSTMLTRHRGSRSSHPSQGGSRTAQ